MKKMGGASEVHAQCEAAGGGKGGAKRGRMGLLLKGIQVLLCNTSQLRTSGKSMYLCTLSLRILV